MAIEQVLERARILDSLGGVAMQCLAHNGGKPLVDTERFEGRRFDGDAEDGGLDLRRGAALDGGLAGQRFVPDQRQSEHIGGRPQSPSGEMLGRHVARGADQGVTAFVLLALHPRQPEIHDARHAIDVDLNVARAQVEMQHFLLMSMGEAAHQLRHQGRCSAHREPPVLPQIVLQRGALDVLEHEERAPLVQTGLIYRNDIRVFEPAQIAAFLERVARRLAFGDATGGTRHR